MRRQVTVIYGPTDSVVVTPPAGEADWPADQARRWLEDQFVALECEPLRASGKVLTADKVLAVATALGPRGLVDDEAFGADFARAVMGALGRSLVQVDVTTNTVTF
jgi:hypothetical protein